MSLIWEDHDKLFRTMINLNRYMGKERVWEHTIQRLVQQHPKKGALREVKLELEDS